MLRLSYLVIKCLLSSKRCEWEFSSAPKQLFHTMTIKVIMILPTPQNILFFNLLKPFPEVKGQLRGQADSWTRPVLVSVNGELYAEKPSTPTYLWTRSEPSRSTAAPYTSGQDTSASGSKPAQSPRDNLRRGETLYCGGVGGSEEPPDSAESSTSVRPRCRGPQPIWCCPQVPAPSPEHTEHSSNPLLGYFWRTCVNSSSHGRNSPRSFLLLLE